MATNVQILKMITGEELLAEIVDRSEDSFITIKNPVRVVVMPTKTNPQTPTVGFAPWAEFSEEKTFTIHKAHVIVTMKPVQEFINQYNSMFGGIVAPSSKLIIPGT
jgi:hypothetical protein